MKDVRPIACLKFKMPLNRFAAFYKAANRKTEIMRNQFCDLATSAMNEMKSKHSVITSYFQKFRRNIY